MSKQFFYLRGYCDSPSAPICEQSPISSLASSLFGTKLDGTPRKRLSLSSTISSTPDSISNSSTLSFASPDEMSLNLPVVSTKSSCVDNSPLSPNQIMKSPANKENIHTPYYSPSHSQMARFQHTPLREVQNLATRNLSFSPLKHAISPSRREHLSPIKLPTPPDECDSSSRDSGYSESGQKRDGFSVPRSCAPTRKLNLDLPPQSSPFKSPSESKNRSFASLEKCDEDDFLMEFICGAVQEGDGEVHPGTSSAFSSLLSAPIQSQRSSLANPPSCNPRMPIRRCLSMIDSISPLSSKVSSSLKILDVPVSISPSISQSSFKRPASPTETIRTKDSSKRPRLNSSSGILLESASLFTPLDKPMVNQVTTRFIPQRQLSKPEQSISTKETERHKIQRCHSESHVSIMKALNVSTNHNGDLTGDFTQALSLPVIQGGKHPDLKTISNHTLASLLKGEYADKIASYKILDCRYPYEFEGGHVITAENWHHPKMIYDYLEKQEAPPKIPSSDSSRHILIFHCEFSAERGPRAQRMLREVDRTTNKDHYPALHFPEIYLLDGGYKSFYEAYPDLCTPLAYVRMLDERHNEDFKLFRSKAKSWAAENRQGRCLMPRTGAKRLGL